MTDSLRNHWARLAKPRIVFSARVLENTRRLEPQIYANLNGLQREIEEQATNIRNWKVQLETRMTQIKLQDDEQREDESRHKTEMYRVITQLEMRDNNFLTKIDLLQRELQRNFECSKRPVKDELIKLFVAMSDTEEGIVKNLETARKQLKDAIHYEDETSMERLQQIVTKLELRKTTLQEEVSRVETLLHS
jgi:hypothetical protein